MRSLAFFRGGGEKAHEGAGADLNRAATGLPQAAGAADLAATSSGAAAEETPFTGIRQYLQQTNAERKRALLSLPNARGVSKTSKMGWGGSRGGIADASQADGTSMYETRQQSQRTSLLAASIGGAGFRRPAGFGSARRGAGGLGASGSPPTASGAGMDWGYQSMMSAGSKRSRDAAEFDAHERERGRSTMPRLSGPPTSCLQHSTLTGKRLDSLWAPKRHSWAFACSKGAGDGGGDHGYSTTNFADFRQACRTKDQPRDARYRCFAAAQAVEPLLESQQGSRTRLSAARVQRYPARHAC